MLSVTESYELIFLRGDITTKTYDDTSQLLIKNIFDLMKKSCCRQGADVCNCMPQKFCENEAYMTTTFVTHFPYVHPEMKLLEASAPTTA